MVKVSNLGYPRLGENREWKKLIESYWVGNISQEELQAEAKALRLSFLKNKLMQVLILFLWVIFHFTIIFWICLCNLA